VLGVAVLLSGALLAAQAPAPPDPAQTRTIYVTVTDRSGLPIEDLTPDDFTIKEGGKEVDVTEARIASEPLQISLIVDDNGTGIFRSALARFVQRLAGHAVMALSHVVGQTMKLVDYTPDPQPVLKGIATLGARPGSPDGGQLLEGISEAAIELKKREAARGVIVALTVGGEEHSTATSEFVLDQLRRSGAALHVFSVESALRGTIAATARNLLQENMHLNRVLGDGPKQSGGRHQSIVAAPGFIQSLQELATELIGQYQVTYTLPPGAKRSDRLNVSVRRKGLSVLAPSKVPS
jgi:VWFA-related protein